MTDIVVGWSVVYMPDCGTSNCLVLEPSRYSDVIDFTFVAMRRVYDVTCFAFVAKRRGRAA